MVTIINPTPRHKRAFIEVRTRQDSFIPNERRKPRPKFWMEAALEMDKNDHDITVRSLSGWGYNCVGMILASRRTWIEPDFLLDILADDGYDVLDDQNDILPGDLVVYRRNSTISHIGVILGHQDLIVGSSQKKLIVLSKWGMHGEYIHEVDDVPERLGRKAEYYTERYQ